MSSLIHDLLQYSSAGGSNTLPAEPTSTEAALAEVLFALSASIRGSGAEVTYDPLPKVWVERHTLITLLQNLIGNAIQAMPDSGRLRITVREHMDAARMNKGISVSVCDTGSGIKPEHARHLFEPFFTTKAAKGTGLGLWISKGIVQKYDGSIHFRSVTYGERSATCFRVTVPVQMSPKRLNPDMTYTMSRV